MTNRPDLVLPYLKDTLSVVIGASSGIGAAIGIAFSTAGSSVVLAGRNLDLLAETARQAQGAGGTAVQTEAVDARDLESIQALAQRVLTAYGTPQVLVNCMGGTVFKEALDVTAEEWDTLHDTQLRGSFFASQAFAAAMAEHGYGKIVNLSSTLAFTVGRGQSVYAAAKAGLSHLTSALALEWAPLGIRVNALAPTATKTPRIEDHLRRDPAREQYLVSRIPLGRLATPEDIVGPALFLASPMSDFVTGHTLLVDGGWVAAK